MNFTTKFDPLIYHEQNKLLFDKAWAKNLKKNKQNLVFGIAIIIVGFAVVMGKNNIGSLFVFMGILILFFFYRFKDQYQKNKKKFFEGVTENILLYNNNESFWNFEEDSFEYRDFRLHVNCKWIAFSGYRRIDNTIFIDSKVGICFMLSVDEVGTEMFDQVIGFLDKKIGKNNL